MKVELKLEPFHHIIIKDFYDNQMLNDVIQELESYHKQGRFLSKEYTESAYDLDSITGEKTLLKNNTGLFFEDVDYQNSSIQQYFNNFMLDLHTNKNYLPKFREKSWFFSHRLPNKSDVLISYYDDSDDYKAHTDDSTLTWLTWVNKEPKKFTGGDLHFPQIGYTIPYENNTAICFYSRIAHRVLPVKMLEKTSIDDLNGRFCITHFMSTDFRY